MRRVGGRRRPSQLLRSLAVLGVTAVVASACSGSEGEGQATTTSVDPGFPTTSTTVPAFVSETYADAASWICHPELAPEPCTTDLDVTVLEEDGTTDIHRHQVADDPGFDCFYVYPTVNLSAEGVAGFDGEYGIETAITRTQAARFSSVCRVYAPIYRQTTFGTAAEVDREPLREQAYADVEEAFLHYLANDNHGRGFVLMGHSQGASHGLRLLQEHVDGDADLRVRLISALLIGSTVMVPEGEGEDVGGDLASIPACRSALQFGCVVSYASFDVTDPPGPAFAGDGEGVALCTNPAALGGGPAPLQMIDPTGNDPESELGADVTTPYVALPGLVTGECVTQDGVDYLAITVHPGDGPRIDTLRSETSLPWGLHPIDVNLALGDLIDLVVEQNSCHSLC